MKRERVIAYVDGFNLYFGLKEAKFRRYYWLNIGAMMKNLLKPDQELVVTKYFTSRVSGQPEKAKRQTLFLEALETLSGFEIYYGHFLAKELKCRRCGNTWGTFEEKMTDVNVATHMLDDAYEDRFDTCLLVSADSDLVPPVRAIRKLFPTKRVVVFFPPMRFSAQLKGAADVQLTLGRGLLAKSQFPDRIVKKDGVMIQRPANWR